MSVGNMKTDDLSPWSMNVLTPVWFALGIVFVIAMISYDGERKWDSESDYNGIMVEFDTNGPNHLYPYAATTVSLTLLILLIVLIILCVDKLE